MFLKYIYLIISLFYIAFADQKIIANDGDAGDAFGHRVLSNDKWIIVSANEDEPNGNSSGSVYIYEIFCDSLGQEHKIFPSDGEYNDFFGKSIALEGDNLAVSSIYDDVNGNKSGSVYIFSYIDSVWVQTQKIIPQDGSPYDRFGYDIDISSNFLAIGSIFDDDLGEDVGSVYIYRSIGDEWILNNKIYPNYVYDGNDFGRSLSLGQNYLAVYYKNINDIYNDQGAVDIFSFNENNWNYIQTISSPDPDNYDYFGVSIDIYESTLVIGSNYDDSNYNNTGAVYIFKLINDIWEFKQKIIPDDVYSNDNFGLSVSVFDGWIAAGSIDDDNGINSGSIYIYSYDDSLFSMSAKIIPTDGNSFDEFGNSLDIYENNIIVGAKYDDDLGENSGSAYFYNFKGCTDIYACNYSDYLISDNNQCFYNTDGFNCDGSCDSIIDECNICGGGGQNGDANQDTQVNIIDIILIVEYILFETNLNVCQIDLNHNSFINITDIILLIENILNYEN